MKCANAKRADIQTIEIRVLLCLDPDKCDGELTETDANPPHHYGCDCDECIDYYRSLK